MIRFFIVAVAALSAVPAQADIFNYVCRDQGKSLVAKIDDVKNTLVWRGKLYDLKDQENCPRFGWRAEREGEGFDFCTATQGYADFRERGALIRCDLKR